MKYAKLAAVLLAGVGLALRLLEEAIRIWVVFKTRSLDGVTWVSD